jgi:hypothetical protein
VYKNIRTIHLLLASLSLPFLFMYGISAVQMAHGKWFTSTPSTRESEIKMGSGIEDARAVAREITATVPAIRGELTSVHATATGVDFRLVLPGTVHEVGYDSARGEAQVKTSVAGVAGMLNRLHHAAGLWHEPLTLQVWGTAIAVVSAMLLLLGATGVYMWFARTTERRTGILLLTLNAVVVFVLLAVMRAAGP